MTPVAGGPRRYLGFKRHLRAEAAGPGRAYLFSEHDVTVLEGPHAPALAALLDGRRDLGDVLAAVPGDASGVAAALLRLSDEGLLTAHAPGADLPATAYWDAAGVDRPAAPGRVRVVALGGLDPAPTAEALRGSGFDVVPDGPAALTAVLCADYLDPALARVDAEHRASGTPWLPVKPVGATVWVGPVFPSDGPGCWHCLAARLWRHRRAEACAQDALGRTGPAPTPPCSLPPLVAASVNVAALQVAQWLAGHRHDGQRAVWTMDSLTLRTEHHELRPDPQCPSCGTPGLVRERAWRPVRLRPCGKAPGGDRALSPGEVLARHGHLVGPVTGIVKQVVPDGPEFFNCYRSGPNVAASVTDLDGLRSALRAHNGGKGVTPLHAEAGALCEAAERHSALFHGDEERVRGTLRGLGEVALHPQELLLHDPRQFADRDRWNAAHAPFQHVVAPFDPDVELDWTPVWSLTSGRHRLVPTAMLYFGVPTGPEGASLRADSNGNAAGGSLEDAVLQGLCELVERDAVAIWWYNRLRVAGLDLDAFADPWVDESRARHAALGRCVWVLDVTSDLGVPVFAALSARADTGGRVVLGLGAHLDARTALRRAVAELNQMMPAVLADADPTADDPDLALWWRTATAAALPHLRPAPEAVARRPGDFPPAPEQDLSADVALVRGRVEAAGVEVLVLDQTRPDVGVPVVKVLAPGLRHFWARFAPGRLFDVPVALGRVERPTPYDRLNPVPVFL
ncbi:TOMM precursor leader peptide-binding protein [Actinosynnema sp. NPDC050436]|uniref:TOMM precursor leader peptide-binding protein n=1 Tax=Actinosynnema sp. NPDC050436 TaxID=3155659 RepID=UPI003400AD67